VSWRSLERGIWGIRAIQLLIIAIPLALWEAASRNGWVDASLLPPPSTIVTVLAGLLKDGRFQDELGFTLSEIVVAFLLVAPLGLGVGFLLGEDKSLYQAFAPALHLLLAVPKSIFLPIFILAFGIGFLEKVVYAMSLAFFVVVLSGISAVQSVPQGLVRTARSFGATRRQIYLQIYLPAMEPLIIGGLRMGLIFTVTGILLAEMYASPRGIGRLIFAWGESFQMPELFAAITLVVAITIVLNQLMTFWENHRRSPHRRRT
jgi:ABC-type nitrate/sulfonate/bicarbonate transport system permease component